MINNIMLIRKLSEKTASDEEKLFYKQNLMSDFEKLIDKPFWDFTELEKKQEDVYIYNHSVGNLSDYDCKECNNRGYYQQLEDNTIVMIPCKCLTKRKVLEQMRKSGLGELLDKYTFENYECKEEWQKDVKIKALAFISSRAKAFTILGQSGAGKTHICTAISERLLEQGLELKYMIWVDEATSLKRVVNEQNYQQKIDCYKTVDVLYIDDFLKTQKDVEPTSADIRLAYEIINARYNKGLITIISSEKTFDKLKQIDEAIAGRLLEMSKEFLINLNQGTKNIRFEKSYV